MRKLIKDAVRCPHKDCNAIHEQEEHAWFCDTCKTQMPDEGLELRVWRHNKAEDDDDCDHYQMCSWECFFRKLSKVRHVDFVSLPLASATRGRRFLELKRFVKPLLA